MARLRTLFASLALVLTAATVAAPVAVAQGTTVVVIDQGKIMRETRAGKDIQAKVANIETQMKAELQPTATALETEGKTIEAKTANMTREAMAADAALRTQVQAYAQKAQQYNQDRGTRAQDLAFTERKAWGAFFTALQPVLQEVVNEKNAQVMLDRSEVVFASPAIDVSALVISKMDAKVPTITVTREKAPVQQQPGQ